MPDADMQAAVEARLVEKARLITEAGPAGPGSAEPARRELALPVAQVRRPGQHERCPGRGIICADRVPTRRSTRPVPPIDELTRIEPVLLERLDHMGIFTTGLLLEVSETPTRRQTLADQLKTDTTEVLTWRDEALMLNLASFGPAEHQLVIQAGIDGLKDILGLDLGDFRGRLVRAAGELEVDPPSDLTIEGWWDQARTLEEE
jgi:hypothetical protein